MSATHSVCKATLLYRSTWPFVIIERFAERRDSRTGSEHHTPSHLYYTELLPHRRLQGWEHDMWKNPQFWQVFPPFSQLAPSHQYYTELFFHTVDCKDGNMTCGKTHSSDRFFHHSVNWQSACSNTHTHTHTHMRTHTSCSLNNLPSQAPNQGILNGHTWTVSSKQLGFWFYILSFFRFCAVC